MGVSVALMAYKGCIVASGLGSDRIGLLLQQLKPRRLHCPCIKCRVLGHPRTRVVAACRVSSQPKQRCREAALRREVCSSSLCYRHSSFRARQPSGCHLVSPEVSWTTRLGVQCVRLQRAEEKQVSRVSPPFLPDVNRGCVSAKRKLISSAL